MTDIANLRRHRIRVYGTFIFGYDGDTPESFDPTVAFAQEHALYIAAFNHLTPFPGTPLYRRLEKENRLLYEAYSSILRSHFALVESAITESR